MADQSHIAELLLSGLLYRTSSDRSREPDAVLYEFYDGVRDLLLELAPFNQSSEVVARVSAYLEERAEHEREMRALLALPGDFGVSDLPESVPFARIRAFLLRGLGYKQLANLIERVSVQTVAQTSQTTLVTLDDTSLSASNLQDDLVGDSDERHHDEEKVVQQPFPPRPVAATAEELAAAQATLAALPTATIPPPQDVLPPGSWLGGLRRNHQFVGREADLLALATLLKGGQSVAVNQSQAAVASGLGGIGKTQLAVEFAYRYGSSFAGVFWLSFAQPDTIPTEFARLGGAAHLQLFTDAAGLKLDEQVNLVRSRLACGLPYLLIFDNCEDPQLVREHHPGGATRVLITSRNPAWP
ncbi:hypothetical protein EYB53_024725, partial [Candidatus Chloroploca sp. M-50]|nr:hypothetical protein [Candidatus Chloroploca mongolica]